MVSASKRFAMGSLVDQVALTEVVIITVILGLVINPLLRTIYNLTFHPLAALPGPKPWGASRLPFLWALIRGELVHELEAMHRRYGPVIRVAPDEVAYAHPDAWNDIFLARFAKDPTWWGPMDGAAPGILTADEETHGVIRRMMNPGFTTRAMGTQEQVLHTYTDLLVSRWSDAITAGNGSAEIDVMKWFNFFTFDVFGELAFTESFDCLRKSEYHGWISLIFTQLKYSGAMSAVKFYPLLESLLKKMIPPSLQKAKQDHGQMIVDKVQRRLGRVVDKADLMSNALLEGEGTKTRLPVGMIHSTFSEFAVAASDTTAMALSAAVNLLVWNEEKMTRLVKDVRGRFKGYEEITVQGVRDMEYLNAVLHEVLRLCPPVPWNPPRVVPEGGAVVCGKVLPGGTRVSLTFTSMHREPSSFHDALSFCPERWLPDAVSNPKSPFYNDKRQAWQPFTVGPHSCIGQNIAWAEMRLVMAKLLWTFDLSAPEKSKRVIWEDMRTFLLIEKVPLVAVVKARSA
ncbi:cytochrome P450 [Podospora aff. communis PSN243]|uniref:Cytochrome P450 n=1 Tax=Podospora aff. communis PSN243 TaxID=3040156 RepID=A0AAV9GSN6_9PEZI|nr:cytochrome P450 [Podospora aff. communis PSN243]